MLRLEIFYNNINDFVKDAKTLVEMFEGKYTFNQKRVNRILEKLDKADLEINEIGIVKGFFHDYLLSIVIKLSENTRKNYKDEEKLFIAKSNYMLYLGYKETLDNVFDVIKSNIEELYKLYN